MKNDTPLMVFATFSRKMGSKIHGKSMKNRLKFESQDEVPLGIDFLNDFGGFGRQVGRKNRAQMDPKSIQKGIENMMRKKRRLGASRRSC